MPRLTRRQLFWVGGLGLAAGALGGFWAIQPRRRRVEDTAPDRLDRFPNPVRVVVVGGGLAGMSAALELAERGAAVTLVEAASHLGGKLGGWPIEIDGETYPMEHGFHGFFAQYYNLDDVIHRLGLDDGFVPAPSYPMLFRDGEPENFEPGSSGFPLNLAGFYLSSNNLGVRSMTSTSPQMQALLQFDAERTYAELDEISFQEFCDQGVDPAIYDFFFGPFAKTTLNDPGNVSAAYVLQFFHFYYLGNPEGLSFRYTRDDSMTGLIDPWRTRLESLGVDVVTGAEVRGVTIEDGQARSVELGRPRASAPLVTGFDPGGVGEGAPVEIGRDAWDVPLYAVRLSPATEGTSGVVAMRGRCTHQGCPLRPVNDGFSCPCHGGRFDREGTPVSGPPDRPLERLRIDEDRVLVGEQERRSLPADYVVVATDVGGTRMILGNSDVPEGMAARIGGLKEADPYVVVRLWFDREVPGEGAGFFTTGQYELLDSIGIYERLQRPAREWADAHHGAIVELHSYGVPPHLDRGRDANRDVLVAEFLECMPEYADAKIIHEEVMQQSNFAGFPPGSHASRPRTVTEVPNLFLAGDWVRLDLPVALMEAAVTSGRLAANEILAAHGVRAAPYDTVAMQGPLA
jgi:isorenieratene synthase